MCELLIGLSHLQGSVLLPVPEHNFETGGAFTPKKKNGSEPEKLVPSWNQKKFFLGNRGRVILYHQQLVQAGLIKTNI